MNLSAIHKNTLDVEEGFRVVCDIGGYEFVSYSQEERPRRLYELSCL